MASSSSTRRTTPQGKEQPAVALAGRTPARASVVLAVAPDAATAAAAGAAAVASPLALDMESSQRLLREVPTRVAAALKLGPHELPVVKGARWEAMRLANQQHFEADAITTARWLLGARLVRVLPDGRRLSGRVVECEAYLGVHDAAAHSFRARRTAKNEAMYRAGGTACTHAPGGGGGGAIWGCLVRSMEAHTTYL
jgi:hypothetical protein